MNAQEQYIADRMKEFAQNIDEFSVDEIIIDSDGAECTIADKTVNSIRVFIKKKNDKHGVNTWQWFDMRDFNKRFKKNT